MNILYDIVAVGELLIDFTPAGKSPEGAALYAQNPGGAPANVLAMCARLGGRTAFIGKVGKDAFGDYLKGTLDGAGIDSGGLIRDARWSTTLAFVHLDERGDRSFSFCRSPGADLMLVPEEIDRDLAERAGILHFGAVSLTGEPCRGAVYHAVALARLAGRLVSFDPNYRAALWQSPAAARKEILAAVPQADLLKVSDEEMTILTGETSLEAGSAALRGMGPAAVFITLGSKGAYYSCAGVSGKLPAYDVPTVDTTGAGDAFWGALLHCLRGKSRADISAMGAEEWADAVDFANAAGSLTTTAYGAIPAMPSLEAIKNCQKSVPKLLR